MSAPLVEPTRDEFRKFLEEAALYDKLPLPKGMSSLMRLLNQPPPLDAYCDVCERPSTFGFHSNSVSVYPAGELENFYFDMTYKCSRDGDHVMGFYLRAHGVELRKIGQYPALADIVAAGLSDYRKVLSKEHLSGLKKAVGLAAHGVGAGSLVYLRRVFEALIKETIDLASVEPTWDQAAFDQLRYLDKKIEFLKDRLPGFLVENKHFYGLMSAGIHNLSEQECLHLFPIALDGICAILDQKVDVQKSREREESAKANINALAHLIKA